MKITEIEDPDLLNRLGHSDIDFVPQAPRTQGVLHLSDIYKRIMIRRDPVRFDPSKPMDLLRVEIGLLFESVLERALAAKFSTVRPGELVSAEGIYMTPDGANPMFETGAGEEYKATYMSCGKGIKETVLARGVWTDRPLKKFEHWFLQMMGLAKHLFVNLFLLRVLFINGDYQWHKRINPLTGKEESYPTGPLLKSYRCEFTDDEIDENWDLLLRTAREEGLL